MRLETRARKLAVCDGIAEAARIVARLRRPGADEIVRLLRIAVRRRRADAAPDASES
jgi:hypothetical protein